MPEPHDNRIQKAVRSAATALVFVGLAALCFHALIALMHLFVPTDKRARRKLAKKLGCDAAVLPEAFAVHAVIYGCVAVVWLIVALVVYAMLFTREDGSLPGLNGR